LWEEVVSAFEGVKTGAIEFVHFSACEIVDEQDRRGRLQEIAGISGARWVSGYSKGIDWLTSMLLDIAVIADLYLPFYHDTYTRRPQLRKRAKLFLRTYEQLARSLGFSGLACRLNGINGLVPQRMQR